jgi:hypothetical protein
MNKCKYFRLTAGVRYVNEIMLCAYFETREDAEKAIEVVDGNKSYVILGKNYEWHEIIDMREYIYGKSNDDYDLGCYIEIQHLGDNSISRF